MSAEKLEGRKKFASLWDSFGFGFDPEEDFGFGFDPEEETPVEETCFSTPPLYRGTNNSAGHDLKALEGVVIEPGAIVKIDTGVVLTIPSGYYGKIESRSSMACKGIIALGGVIDSDYHDSVRVISTNLSDKPVTILPGERIAQIILHKYYSFDNSLILTGAPHEGFGSTGRL